MTKYFIVFLCLIQTICFAENNIIEKANNQYSSQEYSKAIISYNELIQNGYYQYELFYNIGNCYFKMDSIGKAILYYEKALKFNSNDKNLKNNLKICNNLIIDKQEYIDIVIIKNIKHKIINILNLKTWIIILLLSLWTLTICLIKKDINFKIYYLIFFMMTISVFSVYQYYNNVNNEDYGIIIQLSSDIKSSPSNNGNTIFTLHEGAKIEILQQNNTWSEISINNETGWVKNKNYIKI